MSKNLMDQKIDLLQSSRELQMDDSFKFKCASCGNCCYGHDDIILTGQDIYRIAKKLKISTFDAIKKCAEVHIGSYSKMPVLLMQQNKDGSCPLLSRGRCTVHDHKPVTCAIYPVGRIINENTIKYFLMKDHCNHGKTTYTLREWLEKFNLLGNDDDIFAWQNAIMTLDKNETITWYRDNYNNLTNKTYKIFTNILCHILYGKYETNLPYADQLKTNVQDFISTLGSLEAMMKQINSAGGETLNPSASSAP